MDVEASSGKEFADMGLKNPEEPLAKAELVQRICDIIAERKLNQVRAARLLGIDQPKVSALLRGRLDGFSANRLFRFLNCLGSDVEIVVRPARGRKRAGTRVVTGSRSQKVRAYCKTVDYGRERDMPDMLAVFVGDQRHRQGAAGAEPFDEPTLSLVAVGDDRRMRRWR